MFPSQYLPCTGCGEPVDRLGDVPHRCDPERAADFRLAAMQDEIAGFELQLQAYLTTPRGAFEAWHAARKVRGTAGC